MFACSVEYRDAGAVTPTSLNLATFKEEAMSEQDSTAQIEFIPIPKNQLFRNKTGELWGRWTVLGYAGRTQNDSALWWCKCECGTVRKIKQSKKSISCGCLNRERVREAITTHGRWGERLYWTWHGMMQRCGNPKSTVFKNYGGRGIAVCERWKSFENFAADVGKPPTPKHSLDRINNEGDYEPSNVRWATKIEQCNNTRRTRFLELNGERKSLMQWSRDLGVSYGRLQWHLRNGKTFAEIVALVQR